MGFFKDVKQGIGLTVGNKVAEGGISFGKKVFRSAATWSALIVAAGVLRTCIAEPKTAINAFDDKGTFGSVTLKNTIDNLTYAFAKAGEAYDAVTAQSRDRQRIQRCKRIAEDVRKQIAENRGPLVISEDDQKFFNDSRTCPSKDLDRVP